MLRRQEPECLIAERMVIEVQQKRCASCAERKELIMDIAEEISRFERLGLEDALSFSPCSWLKNGDEKIGDVRYWKILSYIMGTRDFPKDYKRAREMLESADTPNEERFAFLSGLLYLLQYGNLTYAEVFFMRACMRPTRESWYYLGECQYQLAQKLQVPEKYKFSTDISCRNAYEKYVQHLVRAYTSFSNSYNLGSSEALLGMGKCSLAADSLRGKNLAMERRFHTQDLCYEHICYYKAAELGYAKGWLEYSKFGFVKSRECVCVPLANDVPITAEMIEKVWSEEHNISKAYWLSQRYDQSDALPHYILGVVYECGVFGFTMDGGKAVAEFRIAAAAEHDILGYVKNFAQEHIAHIASLREYKRNFGSLGYGVDDSVPDVVRSFWEYEVAVANDKCFAYPFPDERWRKFLWWYAFRLAISIHDDITKKSSLLISTHSPEALLLMAKTNLYNHPLHTYIHASTENQIGWIDASIKQVGGCPEAFYAKARAFISLKTNHLATAWYMHKDDAYDNVIINALKQAAEWGFVLAKYELLMAARYGVGIYEKSKEEVAKGFLALKNEGHVESRFEYTFCQYEHFGVEERAENFHEELFNAACANYGKAREFYEELCGFTYWADIDRGCQEI